MQKNLKLLVVEDSEDDAILLLHQIKSGGYSPDIKRVQTIDELEQALADKNWDIIITDHNLPGATSNDVIKSIRDSGIDTPIIVVSGSIGEDVAVDAMKLGASDYIMKDNLTRLIPAIERELKEGANRRAHKRAQERIRHMAYHDSLTGLVNRSEFEARVRKAMNSAKERDITHALCYLDLDQFKVINDTSGHVAGDELLRHLAHIMKQEMRDRDTLARLGGDEFGILLENCTVDDALLIANKILYSIKQFRFTWEGKTFVVGGSIGLVSISAYSTGVGQILSHADIACYAAKERGRNRVHVYTEDDSDLSQRQSEMQWVARINEALEQNRLLLHAQKIIPLNGDNPGNCHYEFLMRIQDEKNSALIGPGAFIPAAERYNLMPALDRRVIEIATSHLADVMKTSSYDKLGKFFVNLSGASLDDQDLYAFILDRINTLKIPPDKLCFEITETAAIANLSDAISFIEEVKKDGCSFALDDFGSGLSSFSYLKTLPVDYLKIDGMFIRDMINDPMDQAIVEAINQIGHVVGLKTIAEFVEDEATLNKLKEIGVDFAQGFGIHKPGPIEK